jgi:FMN phosphatase YigB (HAD superfamily)
VDVIGTSDTWGVEKPSAAFFERVVVEAGCPASQVLYVGDRLDNDIRPAQTAGLATALVRRGPWGYILDDPQVAQRCLFRVDSLAELTDLVRKHNETA